MTEIATTSTVMVKPRPKKRPIEDGFIAALESARDSMGQTEIARRASAQPPYKKVTRQLVQRILTTPYGNSWAIPQIAAGIGYKLSPAEIKPQQLELIEVTNDMTPSELRAVIENALNIRRLRT